MADKPIGTDLVTKLNAANMQPLWNMVWDGLGESPVPTNVRTHIQAQPVSPTDGKNYMARDGGWVENVGINPVEDVRYAIAGQTVFALASEPSHALWVSINGVAMSPGQDYTFGGVSVTFSYPLAGDDLFMAKYF